MKRAWYMQFVTPTGERLDRIGGLPSHRPERIPSCPTSGREMAFLAQFYTHPERLPIPNVLCLHIYQCLGVDEGEDPAPVVVAVPVGTQENSQQKGVAQSRIVTHEIEWEEREDPDSVPASGMDESTLRLYQPKAGGANPFDTLIPDEDRVLLVLTQYPCNLNLAGLSGVVVQNPDGSLEMLLV
jgi:hypothetical protein